MSKKGLSGLTLPSDKAKKTTAAAQTAPAAAAKMPSNAKKPVRDVITNRIMPEDKQALMVYAVQNGTKVQELLNQALKLLAVERDIELSDEIMKE